SASRVCWLRGSSAFCGARQGYASVRWAEPFVGKGKGQAMKTTWRAKSFSAVFSSVVAMLCLAGPASGQPFEWRSATPASQGMSKEKLDALKDELAKRKTKAFLIVRNGKIVYEWYAAGHGPKKKHGAASLSKPTVAGLALALLLTDGKLKL